MSLPKTMPMKSAKGTIEVPSVGFGTYAPGDTSWCYAATLEALKAGYRHLDCAWNYGVTPPLPPRALTPGGLPETRSTNTATSQVDEAVGAAIRDSGIPRSELFITSKFWPQFGAPENVEKCLEMVLANMSLEYVDLFLAHWPVTFQAGANIGAARAFDGATAAERGEVLNAEGQITIDWAHSPASIAAQQGENGSYVPTWRALQSLVATGKVRAVGVSNFNLEQLREVLGAGGEVPVSCNQVEAHPWLQNIELFAFMKKEGILASAYCPFSPWKRSGPRLLQDPAVQRLAEKNDMGVGQLLQSWAVQRGTIPLGKSQTPGKGAPMYTRAEIWCLTRNADRIQANLDVRVLPEEDMQELNSMDQGEAGRTVPMGGQWGVTFF